MAKNLRRQLGRIKGKLSSLEGRVRQILTNGARRFESTMEQQRLSGPTGPNSLSARTGALRRSLRHNVDRPAPETFRLEVGIGKGVPYAGIHEEGGIVRPKKGRALAVPLDAAKTGAGIARGGPRDFPGLFLLARPSHPPLLVRVVGKGRRSKLQPMFALVPQVSIPPRLGFREMWLQQVPLIEAELQAELKKVAKA